MQDAGFQTEHFIFPHGEQHKTLATYGRALNFLCDRRFTREDVIIALGGGVVGDLAGFTAATYQRGITYIQVPTTLLSMMPEREYRCGCAEIIKTAMLFDAGFFRELCQTPVRGQLEHVLSVCVAAKRDVVQSDEFDRGQRALLNFGHTVGHAVEACRDFTISHGEGVAIGMAVVTRAAVNRGICPPETLTALLDLLEQYKLPTEATESLADILHAAEADKKRTDDAIRLIVPKAVGCCRAETVPAVELADWLRDGGLK